MKRLIYILLVTALFVACQKADHNGDLGGNWKLLKIEDTATGDIINKRYEDRFWAIQLNLIKIGQGKGRFQHVGDSLYIQMIYKTDKPEEYGLYNQDNARYGIEHLSRKRMILSSEDIRLEFTKF